MLLEPDPLALALLVVGSNPASPISRSSGEVVVSEEVPEGWWDVWVAQRAKESLPASFSTVLLCRDSLKGERKENCLAVSDDAPMLHPITTPPMNFFRTLAMVGLVILFGIGCYIAGGYVSTKKIIRGFNVGNLLWITEINRQIELQNNQKAEELCFSTAQGNFSVLNRLDKDALLYSIMTVCLWTNPMDERTKDILTKAKIFYSPKASKMFPDAREYLNNIKEVPIPVSLCNKSTNTSSTSKSP